MDTLKVEGLVKTFAISEKQRKAQEDHADGRMKEIPVEALHIIIDPGAGHRGFLRLVRIADGIVQRVVEIRHDAQGIQKDQGAHDQRADAQDLLQRHLFFIHN